MIFSRSDGTLAVTILVLPDSSLLSLAATLDPMRGANRVAGRVLYRWQLVSWDGAAPVTTSGLPIAVDGSFDPAGRQDLLIVVGAFNVTSHATPSMVRAVRRAARKSLCVGGVEQGPWVLAMAGLLDGREATTHWEDLEEFASRFPNVRVRSSRFVNDGSVFTTCGAAPALDLMLSLIRARQGNALALDVASLYVYEELHGGSEAQYPLSLGKVKLRAPRVAEAIRTMERHVDEPLSVAKIARRTQVSIRTLEQLFRKTVGTTPGDYYLSLRLSAARRLIVDTCLPIADAADRTGFSSASTLSRAFRRKFGYAPSSARKQTTRPMLPEDPRGVTRTG